MQKIADEWAWAIGSDDGRMEEYPTPILTVCSRNKPLEASGGWTWLLAQLEIYNLFQRNSECNSQDLSSTAMDLRLPMNTSLNGQKCFSYRGAKLWNALAIEVNRHPRSQFLSRIFLLIKTLIRIFLFLSF